MDRLLETFKTRCDDPVLYMCYKNKLVYNCRYNQEIEDSLASLMKGTEPPWWTEHID